MQEKVEYSETPFDKIPIEESRKSRQEFLDTVTEEKSGEIEEKWDLFYQKLQAEADKKFPGQEKNSLKRDLWFNLQIVLTYMEAKMWKEASEALNDALVVATQTKSGEDVFNKLLKKFPKKE